MNRPSIVCPVDFSEPSRGALHYAAAIGDHFGARLLVVTVDDPLLDTAAASTGLSLRHETERELERFITDTVPKSSLATTVDVRVSVGKPAPEILRIAKEAAADLVVMSSLGRSGFSKRFFGSTTERVLRETTIPVLVTPKGSEPVVSVSEIARHVGRVMAPVDLTEVSRYQVTVAGGIATALDVPLLLAHVLAPLHIPPGVRVGIPGRDHERRANADAGVLGLVGVSGAKAPVETLVVSGDPSEEIVRLAETRHAGLIVMGLHSSGLLGPRMGSITYRVLCLTRSLVLALPPVAAASLAGKASLG
jgi:nucleotide-binding universal stress UspA family protein